MMISASDITVKDGKKNGLKERRFDCQRCGYCCSQKTLIYPSLEEIRNLSGYLSISECSFALRYLQEVYDPQINTYAVAFKTNHPDDPMTGCIFCHDNLFVIHNSPRTDLCNVFPWNHFDLEREEWEENFVSYDGTFWCPGIGRGRLWTLEEIRRVKELYPKVGEKIKRLYNPPPPSGPQGTDRVRPSGFNLTMSEERLIHKLRFLSIDKIREVENMVDCTYHGGHVSHY